MTTNTHNLRKIAWQAYDKSGIKAIS